MRPLFLLLALFSAITLRATDSVAVPVDTTIATLARVTSAEGILSDGQYIFCRNGRVLIESVSSPLPTTDLWRTDSLTGDETYIWKLVPLGSNAFHVVGHYGLYLSNPKGTDLVSTISPQTRWTFEFAEDSTATICTVNTSTRRFIGEKPAYSGKYTAPSYVDYLSSYPHDFIIYRLVFPHPEQPETPESTALGNPSFRGEKGRLVLRNGTVLIEQNGQIFNLLGTRL